MSYPLVDGRRYLGEVSNFDDVNHTEAWRYSSQRFNISTRAVAVVTNGTPFSLLYETTSVQSHRRPDGSHAVDIPHGRLHAPITVGFRVRDPVEGAVYERRWSFWGVMCCTACCFGPWDGLTRIPVYEECSVATPTG